MLLRVVLLSSSSSSSSRSRSRSSSRSGGSNTLVNGNVLLVVISTMLRKVTQHTKIMFWMLETLPWIENHRPKNLSDLGHTNKPHLLAKTSKRRRSVDLSTQNGQITTWCNNNKYKLYLMPCVYHTNPNIFFEDVETAKYLHATVPPYPMAGKNWS